MKNEWMLDYFDEVDGELVRHCKHCSEKYQTKIYVALRPDQDQGHVKRFERRHKWCGRDREWQITNLEADLQRSLTDKERVFTHQCMDEGFEMEAILGFIKDNRQKMPSIAAYFKPNQI